MRREPTGGNPRRFHRSAKWKKVKDDFFHGQVAARSSRDEAVAIDGTDDEAIRQAFPREKSAKPSGARNRS
jgi:hypothetical protein